MQQADKGTRMIELSVSDTGLHYMSCLQALWLLLKLLHRCFCNCWVQMPGLSLQERAISGAIGVHDHNTLVHVQLRYAKPCITPSTPLHSCMFRSSRNTTLVSQCVQRAFSTFVRTACPA